MRRQGRNGTNLMVTIHKLLLAQTNKISRRQEISSLHRSNSTERPARAARTLTISQQLLLLSKSKQINVPPRLQYKTELIPDL